MISKYNQYTEYRYSNTLIKIEQSVDEMELTGPDMAGGDSRSPVMTIPTNPTRMLQFPRNLQAFVAEEQMTKERDFLPKLKTLF